MPLAFAFNLRDVKFSIRFHFSIKFKSVDKYIISYFKYNKVITSCSSVLRACVKLLVCMENATTNKQRKLQTAIGVSDLVQGHQDLRVW